MRSWRETSSNCKTLKRSHAANAIVGEMIPFIAEQSDPESAKEVIRSVVGALIWVPYFLVSKRVKATFTR